MVEHIQGILYQRMIFVVEKLNKKASKFQLYSEKIKPQKKGLYYQPKQCTTILAEIHKSPYICIVWSPHN